LGDFHPKGNVAQLFGIYNDDRGTSNRAIIIIDKEGVVRYVRTYEGMAGLSPEAVLEEVDKL
jgi:peroxiredoxin (alkyl hydroperoxide reductase subunit C)